MPLRKREPVRPTSGKLTLAILSALSSISSVLADLMAAGIESLQQRLVKLSATYTQNASFLPTYEQRRCQEVRSNAIRGLP